MGHTIMFVLCYLSTKQHLEEKSNFFNMPSSFTASLICDAIGHLPVLKGPKVNAFFC